MAPILSRTRFVATIGLLVCTAACASEPTQPRPVQSAESFEGDFVEHVKLRYLLALPDGYDDPESPESKAGSKDGKWPLLVFLHGVGECGEDLEFVKRHGPPKLLAAGKKLPCIVVSPQAEQTWWSPHAVHALLDDLEKKLRVDRSREYLTGLSLGGFGTWAAAIERPDRFAAIVPICGGADWVGVRRLKDVPVWVFHGRLDPVVPLAKSEEAVFLLKTVGGRPKFTIYDDLGHDCWTRAYDDPALWDWLLAQRK